MTTQIVIYMLSADNILWKGIHKHISPLEGFEKTEIIDVEPGYAKLSVLCTTQMKNIYGHVHGGVIFTLCDMAAGISTYAYGKSNVTMQSNINFIKTIPIGMQATITATSMHHGKTTVIQDITITDESGVVYVKASYTMMFTKYPLII